MRAFMLTWNPEQNRPDDLADTIRVIEKTRPVRGSWSTGNRKDLPVGSRVFLMRQGKEPRGIVAAGFTLSEPEQRGGDDDHSFYCNLIWTMVLDDSKAHILCLDELKNTPLLVNVPWGIQCGGREFSGGEATQVEVVWGSLLQRLGKSELPHGQNFT